MSRRELEEVGDGSKRSKGPGEQEAKAAEVKEKRQTFRFASSLPPIRALFHSSPTLRVGRRHGAERAKAILKEWKEVQRAGARGEGV